MKAVEKSSEGLQISVLHRSRGALWVIFDGEAAGKIEKPLFTLSSLPP